MPNCVSLGRPLGGRPGGSPRTSMGWDMTQRGRHRSYQGRPRTPRGRPNCPADVHGTVDALWTQHTLPNFGFNRKPTNRFHQRFTNSISKYLLLGSNPGVPTVEITSRPRPRVVDNCAFIGFCILDWAVPRATKII